MQVTVITPTPRVVVGVPYPIAWTGRISRPGEFHIDLDIIAEFAVRVTEGRDVDEDRLTILSMSYVDVLAAREVVA